MGVGIAGGISTALLIVLFIINVFTNIKKSPARRRRLLCWITSMPMVVSILSLFIFLIPRASDICDTVKQVYLSSESFSILNKISNDDILTQVFTFRLDAFCRFGFVDTRRRRGGP